MNSQKLANAINIIYKFANLSDKDNIFDGDEPIEYEGIKEALTMEELSEIPADIQRQKEEIKKNPPLGTFVVKVVVGQSHKSTENMYAPEYFSTNVERDAKFYSISDVLNYTDYMIKKYSEKMIPGSKKPNIQLFFYSDGGDLDERHGKFGNFIASEGYKFMTSKKTIPRAKLTMDGIKLQPNTILSKDDLLKVLKENFPNMK